MNIIYPTSFKDYGRTIRLCLAATLLAAFCGSAFAQTLINGGKISDAISVPGQEDNYTFAAVAGDHITLRVADINDTGLFPRVELYDPAGTLVRFGQGPAVGTVEHPATTPGTYTVLVRDNSSGGAGVGDYDLYFVKAPGANELGSLVNGDEKTETIDLGDLDTYVFEANAGTNISLEIEDLSDIDFFPRVEVYGPDGSLVRAAQGPDGGSMNVQLSQSGRHTVLVRDNQSGGAGTGDYVLRFNTDGVVVQDTYTVGISPPAELNLDGMDIQQGRFILTSVIGYAPGNLGAELLTSPVIIDATIGGSTFHELLEVPNTFQVLNLIGRFEAVSPAKPPVQFNYLMGPIGTDGPAAATIALPLLTDDFFYQITNLTTGEDVYVAGTNPRPEVSLNPLGQVLAVFEGTNTWQVGYSTPITLGTPAPGQPHGTIGTPSTAGNPPVNLNSAPTVVDEEVTVAASETVSHVFSGSDPDGDSLTWQFVDISSGAVALPVFDPNMQLVTWDTTGTAPGVYQVRALAVDTGNLGDFGTLTVTIEDNTPDTYLVGISPPAELNLNGMDIFAGTFNLTSVIGYSSANPGGVELLDADVTIEASIGSDEFHALLDVPVEFEVLNLIGFFSASNPAKPPARFDFIMGPVNENGPPPVTIALPLFTDDFFYQITDLVSGDDVFVNGSNPRPQVSTTPLSQTLTLFEGTRQWHVGYDTPTTIGPVAPGQPHGTVSGLGSAGGVPVNANLAPDVVDAAITIVTGETANHTFVGADPEGQSLSWRFLDITGPGDIGAQPVFDPDLQTLTWTTATTTTPGAYVARVLAVDPGNAGDIGVFSINVEAETEPLQCDIDGSGTVDRADIALIIAARNQPAEPGDPRDNDGDGVITVLDARQCVLLCTNARCAL